MNPQRPQWLDPRTWMAFAYWELRKIYDALNNKGSSDWKATVVILVVEFLWIVTLIDAVSVHLGRKLINEWGLYFYLVPLILFLLNIKALLGKNKRWNRLSSEFENYSSAVRIGGGWAVVVIAILTLIAAIHFGEAQRHVPP